MSVIAWFRQLSSRPLPVCLFPRMWNTDLDRSDKWCDAAIGPDFQLGQKVRVMEKTLLDLSREIHAISSSGFYFSKDPYDLQRFQQLMD
jgi:hypothetical protein